MKKSTKRSKRRVKTRKKQNVKRAKPHMANDGYSDGSVRLAELFRSRDPHDICVALNVSDLWLPNVASQIRHTFAFCVLASIKPAEFTSEKGLDSYDDFRDFIREVQKLAPTFPMLEDYVPETDWGEVKTLSGDKFLRLFYGCSIERMSDFVEAFKVKYDGMDLPLADLHIALSIQNAIISQIDRDIVGNPTNCAPGHMELPSETFWKQCSSAIKSIAAPSAARGKISDDMVIALGTLTLPADASAFSNALMNGKLLQAVLLTIDSDRYPISIRNSLGAVIDYWSASEVTQKHITITSSVANFLSKRFPQEGVLTGPLSIVTPTSKLPYRFAALANLGHRCELIVVLGEKELPLLPQIEEDVRRLLSSGQQWGIKQDGLSRVAQIGDKDHNLIGADNVSLIAVTTDISTAARVMHLPETSAHVLWLPDFLTIFDSLKGVDELTRFWSYLEEVHPQISFGLTSIVDMFATFRDTHGVLIEGALNPTSIFLDPHWGSSWRYRELKEFWENAPAMFPGDSHAGWTTSPPSGGIGQLIARASHSMSWYTTIGRCVLHFVMQLDTQELDSLNGRLLELLVQCLADSLFERRAIVEHLEEFKYQRIVTILEANEALLAANAHTEESVLRPLFSNWQIDPISDNTVSLAVAVNLTRVQTELTNPKASQFEVECASEWIAGIERLMGTAGLANCVPQLVATGSRTPRFSISVTRRTIDAPDHAQARLPEPTQYKAARRDLAVTFRALGVSPGRYELAAGKAAMDPARDQFRADIRARVAKLDRIALLTFCIEQHDALTVDYVRTTSRIRHSLTHQVSFDRPAELAKAYDHFSRNARNYRYLIELCLSEQSDGSEHPTRELIVELIAKIDWLFVLYDASDVLHNDIEVAGIEISDSFVPKVFYSADRDKSENSFSREMARLTLGTDLNDEDAVVSPSAEHPIWQDLDIAFTKDTGFSFSGLIKALGVLSRWQTVRGREDLHLSYTATPKEIACALSDSANEESDRVVQFLTLQPNEIRRLIGKTIDEGDVPVWDHTKRGHRYTIRPLIPSGEDALTWGAGAAERALGIWTISLKNGYLPADFQWPHVQRIVRSIKENLENSLEDRAGEICSRNAPFVEVGIDFKRRFPKERFEDVGDFDVLAYWPLLNVWLIVECKYNQPPHCLKDARRLRDRIFGTKSDRGQFSKIERRREFLAAKLSRIRVLLGWPSPPTDTSSRIQEVYVSREIYWWMRHPPYPVSTDFVRIDTLDSWLQAHFSAGEEDDIEAN